NNQISPNKINQNAAIGGQEPTNPIPHKQPPKPQPKTLGQHQRTLLYLLREHPQLACHNPITHHPIKMVREDELT
uniref:Uncharacterized protein n=1 Tax=Oryza brachyantha TaxID=4533 RepID=J3N9I8_ORYBR